MYDNPGILKKVRTDVSVATTESIIKYQEIFFCPKKYSEVVT